MPILSVDSLRPLHVHGREVGAFHSLATLEQAGFGAISRLPISIRIILESMVRNADGERVTEDHIKHLASWDASAERKDEIPFVVARIIAPDASGLPLLADLAAMREVVTRHGMDPLIIEPLVPVDLIVDHSLVVDRAGTADALLFNMQAEFRQNDERYRFLKWATKAFSAFKVVPPGIGIIHQVNIEQLARGVWEKDGIVFPDSLVGTDSHTTMVNGIGVLGWGVGGIEAEAAMLGQPIYVLTPDVIGVELIGKVRPGVMSTDVALTITQRLREQQVVAKFVEFFGEGAARLSAPDRCTISNMAPEYGATASYFPVDEETLRYLASAGRTETELATLEAYMRAQQLFGMPRRGQIDYTRTIEIDLAHIVASVSGPSRPQDRVDLDQLKATFQNLLTLSAAKGAFGKIAEPHAADPKAASSQNLSDGDIVIAAITSCANTSNPGVMLAAGLLAKKAVERGLRVRSHVKTSFTPGSRVVEAYLTSAGLQPYLDQLGFNIAGYGCATCMGNSGPLAEGVEDLILRNGLVVASVLSGNRNFEGRIHQAIRANFLMSPPLVVAFAIAGRVGFDTDTEPLGVDRNGTPVFLKDIWPKADEIAAVLPYAQDPGQFRRLYSASSRESALWNVLKAQSGNVFAWNERSSYLQRPPFFDSFNATPPELAPILGARALAVLGDSVTTDHISPGGAIKADSNAGRFLISLGVAPADFNSYIARRAHHGVMMRGTFANVRLKNLMVPGSEGGVTLHQPDGACLSIFDAAVAYAKEQVPLVVFAGAEYGTGSSRDWAAKGPHLLGVRAVIARGFERIHRSNLVGMGILPCEFTGDDCVESLRINGTESFDLVNVERGISAQQNIELRIRRVDGGESSVFLRTRVDTAIEERYFRHGGILPFVLRELMRSTRPAQMLEPTATSIAE